MNLSRRHMWLVAGLAAVGCLSPTLPLPPPSRPTVYGPDESGNVTLVGSESPEVAVIAENLENGKISGQRTDESGYYEIVIRAQVGDRMAMYYMDLLEHSDTRFFTIPEPQQEDAEGGRAGSGGEAGGGAGGIAGNAGGASGRGD